MLLLEKDIKAVKYVEDLEIEFHNFLNKYSFAPDRNVHPYPKIGDVIDEEQSVRWNREEVERLRNEYDKCVSDLNKNYNIVKSLYSTRMIYLLSKKFKVTIAESEKIWNYSWKKNNEKDVYAAVGLYEDIVDLYKELLSTKKVK